MSTQTRRPLAPLLLALTCLLWGPVLSDEPVQAEEPAQDPASPPAEETTLVERVTVTATRSPSPVRDTPGTTSVILSEEIESLGMRDTRALLRYEPGVQVAGEATRLGLNGFVIRGIGGNRVLTRIDGVQTAEQFDFGPLSTSQFALDLDSVESVEIVRSAGSALYGSDALGGLVSFRTKDPEDYLAGSERDSRAFARAGYEGSSEEASLLGGLALRRGSWSALVQATGVSGHERDNQGTIGSTDSTRTRPNPQDRDGTNVLGKWIHLDERHSRLELALEWFDATTDTEVYSLHGNNGFGTTVNDFDASDEQQRLRLGAEQTRAGSTSVFETLTWRAHAQRSETEQSTVEQLTIAATPRTRNGQFEVIQDSVGGEVQLVSEPGSGRNRITWGAAANLDRFDQRRDRVDHDVATGAPLPSALPYPTKYAPETTVLEAGLYVQDEADFFAGRLHFVPGLRLDVFDLDADQSDAVYAAGNAGGDLPVDQRESALSPKVGIVGRATPTLSPFFQYSRGFRAPPYSDVNSGFTNMAFGYRTLPNPDLVPETSDNFEVGLRGSYESGSFSLALFDNRYEDFIETVTVTETPIQEFQPRNVAEVSIRGIELAGDRRVGQHWLLRGAVSFAEGEDDSTDDPLESIAPPQAVVGARYRSLDQRWQIEATLTGVAAKRSSDLPDDSTQFRTPSYEVVDLTGLLDLGAGLRVQAGLYNLTDETYWYWSDVLGQTDGSATIDRYSAPGFHAGAHLHFTY